MIARLTSLDEVRFSKLALRRPDNHPSRIPRRMSASPIPNEPETLCPASRRLNTNSTRRRPR